MKLQQLKSVCTDGTLVRWLFINNGETINEYFDETDKHYGSVPFNDNVRWITLWRRRVPWRKKKDSVSMKP